MAETESRARWPSGLERWLALATGRCGSGSNPTAENFASELPFTPLCQCLSEETLKAVAWVPCIWCLWLCRGK